MAKARIRGSVRDDFGIEAETGRMRRMSERSAEYVEL